jgi:hypothetical protein
VATLDKSTDLDVVENAHNYINRTISIDWRNRVTAGYLKILLSDQKAEGTKPIYIVVGKLHLEGLSELLQLNFGSSFKVKSLFLNTDPDLQGTFDNLEDKTVLESSAKKILAEGIPETDTYDVKVGKIYVLVKYKNYLQSNNRAYEANTIQKFLGDLSLESEGLEKFINIANGSSTYVNADKALLKMNAKLKKASPTDTGSLLGENGLLTLALNRANLVIGTDSPDFEACSETMDLGTAIIAKLIDEKADVTSVVEKLTALSSKMSAYSKALNSKTASETSLDKILEKKALGETEFNELFGNANGVAASIMEQYNKDPKDPLNAIRVLIVEKLLRHFETVSNEKDAPAFSSEIIKNDFFRTDSDTYTTWKTVVDKIKVEELKAETADKKEALEKYKIDLKSIDEFKVE